MSDQFTKTRARAERLASLTDRLIGVAETAVGLDDLPDAEKACTALGHVHAALCEERAYLNDMVDEVVMDEDALDFDEDTED